MMATTTINSMSVNPDCRGFISFIRCAEFHPDCLPFTCLLLAAVWPLEASCHFGAVSVVGIEGADTFDKAG